MSLHLVHRVAVSVGLVIVASGQAAAQGTTSARSAIPSSIRDEHREIHDELAHATSLPGATGSAARALAAVLGPHFEREEQIALPPLGLLAPLARGDRAAAPAWLLPMTDSLRRELPQMLREHQAIKAANARLAAAARTERQAEAQRLSEKLSVHARTEEEVLYPAAIVVGDLVRARASRR